MPDFFDDLDWDDSEFYWDEELGADVRDLPFEVVSARLDQLTSEIETSFAVAQKIHRAVLATYEPRVAAWYSEIAALSAKDWRTPTQQARLESLRDEIERLPEFVSRMGPPPWGKRVVDTVVIRKQP